MGRYRCEVLEQAEADKFVSENHSQGALQAKSRAVGLYTKDELVGVLQVGPPRTSLMTKLYSAEIYRLAFKRGTRSPGGASKLVKSYIQLFHPADFFTYQDTSGENTKVYEHCGMSLVKDGKNTKKQYLVAPGKTLESGSRKDVLGMAYATRYGPDRILGTKLGEVFREDGFRKSNKEIFLEDLGWHIEETSGDSLWEWVDPNRTYYTYKITASDSDKYYYGVSHVKLANATVEDCLNDGYYGSGNSSGLGKFGRWKSRHRESLQKQVLSLYPRKSLAYIAEGEVVGELYKNDPLCLNSTVGGKVQPHAMRKYTSEICPIHGEALHSNGHCLKCQSAKNYSEGNCEIHGTVKLHGNKCLRCQASLSRSMKECLVHGVTAHQGAQCYKCMAGSKLAKCDVHGKTAHYGGVCMKCRNEQNVFTKECQKHGLVKHIGDKCYQCLSSSSVQLKVCSIHGETKHRGDSCFKCRGGKSGITEKVCPTHGLSKHQGDTCAKCSRGTVVIKECSVHGSTKHRGGACFKCAAAKRSKKD